jgi:hypothetical protein
VYDVTTTDYRLRPQDVMFLAIPQAVVVFCWVAALVRLLLGAADPWKQVQALLFTPVVSAALYGFYHLQFGPWVWTQLRCRRWLRAGEYTTTEGVVSGYESRFAAKIQATRKGTPKRTVSFRVAEQPFAVSTQSRRGGLRLDDIGLDGDHSEFIWNGKQLRVAHRDGYVLRIEVLESDTPPTDAGAVPLAHEPGVEYVRVVAPPPWAAPPEFCRVWVGMELPVLKQKPYSEPTGGLLGRLFGAPANRPSPPPAPTEYEVDAPQALMLLAGSAPWAADWYRGFAAANWGKRGSTFVFPAAVCEVIEDETTAPARVAPLAVDPTFDPPADRLPASADVPSFLDRPPPAPPGRLRRVLVRAACLAWLAIVVAGTIDYLYGSQNRGFGVWLFDLATGALGVVLGRGVYRLQEREIARGESRASIGRRPGGEPGIWVALVVGAGFLMAGLGITASFVQDPPESAPAMAKKRFEVDKKGQWGLAPILVMVGSIAITFGVATLAKTYRRR